MQTRASWAWNFVLVQELHRMRATTGRPASGRQPHGRLGVGFVAVETGALQLDVGCPEQERPLARQRQRRHGVAGVQRPGPSPMRPPDRGDQAFLALQPFAPDLGRPLPWLTRKDWVNSSHRFR